MPPTRSHCTNESRMGGELSYTELLTCLEMARDVRAMRAAEPQDALGTPRGPAEAEALTGPISSDPI